MHCAAVTAFHVPGRALVASRRPVLGTLVSKHFSRQKGVGVQFRKYYPMIQTQLHGSFIGYRPSGRVYAVRLLATATDAEFSDLRRLVSEAKELVELNEASCPSMSNLENQVADLERESSDPSFWDNPNSPRTKEVNKQLGRSNRLLVRLKRWEELVGECNAALSLLEELREAGEDDEDTISMIMGECAAAANELLEDGKRYELESLLSGPYDDRPARMLLTAGAGGTEACDWVDMLMRMYTRHAEKMGYRVTVEDKTAGDVVGYKSVDMLVEGPNAYGWLRAEKGAHRLVRLSPFNANNKRQTTFAGVDVVPILGDEEVADVNVPDSELEISTLRSGGKGG